MFQLTDCKIIHFSIGNGVNQYKVMCDPEANPAPPKFILIEKNIIDSNLIQDEKKVYS